MLLGYGRAQATTPTERFRGVTSEIASGRTRKIALVAQRIEHWPPAPGVAGSIPAEGAIVTPGPSCSGAGANGVDDHRKTTVGIDGFQHRRIGRRTIDELTIIDHRHASRVTAVQFHRHVLL